MRLFIQAALLAASSLAAAPALAQEGETDIIVTATRSPAALQTLPADATLIDVEAALVQGETSLSEALQAVDGLGVVASGGAGQQTSLFAGGANSNHTLVLFDGIRINDPSTPGSSFDAGQDQIFGLDRIEVVEGPMSAVFGSDAIGGVVNLMPRRGGEGPLNAQLQFGGGAYGTLRGAAGIDGTLGAFRYAVTADAYATEGYDLVPERMSTRTGEKDGFESSSLTAAFDFAATAALSFDLLARYRQARADFDPFLFDAFFNEFRAEDDNLEISQNDLGVARLGATWEVTDALSLRATYGAMSQKRAQSDDGAVTDRFEGERSFADLTLTWRPAALAGLSDVALIAGVSGEREEVDIAQGFGFPPPSFFTRAEQDQRGGFVTAQARLQALTLTGAVRIDDYKGFGTNTTWRLGGSLALSEQARLYAAYGTSFRAPTLYERFVSFGNPELDPEHGESWEIGADARLSAFGSDHGAELGVLFRRTEIDDLIDFGPFFTYANVERAEIDTAEARAALRPLPWLTLRASYVFTDARDVQTDTALLRRPENAWRLSAEATHGGWRGQVEWRSVGERRDFLYGDDGFSLGQGLTPEYELARASLSYTLADGAELYLAVENALDETYEPVNAFAGAPRGVFAGVRLRSQP